MPGLESFCKGPTEGSVKSVLVPKGRQVDPENINHSSSALQLLLFVDERPSSQEQIQRIKTYLQELQTNYPFEFQTIEVGAQPDLVEHFRLIATPSLVKIYPEPRQTLTGSDLIGQLQQCWSRWQEDAERHRVNLTKPESPVDRGISYALDRIRLDDEIFKLKKENEDLQAQLQFKDQVLVLLAHDLRSPLTAASIALETLEMLQNRDPSEWPPNLVEHLCKQARAQLRTMNRMISEILQAARDKSSQLRLACYPVQLKPLCEEILAGFERQIEGKSLGLLSDIPQDLPMVYADAELIRQVLVNLLENAVKYTQEGGRISLSILHRTSGKVQVSVEDTGPGIPEEKRDRIFEGHFRLKRDEGREGYGLGLALCRKVVRAHHGQIWVDSVLGQGSCFNFTLPVYRG
ncbi:histidine kinase [Oscillatoria sp. FACHB-1406]|nr:histidine kinase [Oscillatoria sp. FACHB-1406]MBD2578967.1 histidine kinase [Oscillatoria sp. FACHB-1406]